MSGSACTVRRHNLNGTNLPRLKSVECSSNFTPRQASKGIVLPRLRSLDDTFCKLEDDRQRSARSAALVAVEQPSTFNVIAKPTGARPRYSRRPSKESTVGKESTGEKDQRINNCASGAVLDDRSKRDITIVGGYASSGIDEAPMRTSMGTQAFELNVELLRAAALGDAVGVDAALGHGADVNATFDLATMRESIGEDAEVVAAQLRFQKVESSEYVFTVGDFDAVCPESTALVLACRGGFVPVARRLLRESGIDVNRVSKERINRFRDNQTPLHWACRFGHLDIVRLLINDERVKICATTSFGFTPFALAIQQGHLDVVEEFLNFPRFSLAANIDHPIAIQEFTKLGCGDVLDVDCVDALHVLVHAGNENRPEVAVRCLQDPRIRRFYEDESIQNRLPRFAQGCRMAAIVDHSPTMLDIWLGHGLASDGPMMEGSPLTMFDYFYAGGRMEHVRVCLKYDCDSTLLTALGRAQLRGDAKAVQTLLCSPDSEHDVPVLHAAVCRSDTAEHIKTLIESARADLSENIEQLDQGKLPAVFYAIELCNLAHTKILLRELHGFPSNVVDQLLSAMSAAEDTPGARSFAVCRSLVESKALEQHDSRKGALTILKTWCSSLIAALYLSDLTRFRDFAQLCQQSNDGFYAGVDEQISKSVLQRAGAVALDLPVDHVRQDDDGIVPSVKFYRCWATRSTMSFDHEAAVAISYSYLGAGLERVFETDMNELFKDTSYGTMTAPPKTFARMQNKLLNPAEHGNPSIKRPRCARNVDVLRGLTTVKSAVEMEHAFQILQSKYKIVRVKNTHNMKFDWKGGYRSLLVNFVYEPGVTWGELFGGRVTFDLSDLQKAMVQQVTQLEDNDQASLWQDFAFRTASDVPKLGSQLALQGLQIISYESPDKPVRMIAELQLVLEPYALGRPISHLLFKVSRCDTGAMEMVRDFYQEYYHKELRLDPRMVAVSEMPLAIRAGRQLPARAPSKDLSIFGHQG